MLSLSYRVFTNDLWFYKVCPKVLFTLLAWCVSFIADAQELEVNFDVPEVKMDQNGFGFNRIFIKNSSQKKIDFRIKSPKISGFQLISSFDNATVSVAPGSEKILPVRFSISPSTFRPEGRVMFLFIPDNGAVQINAGFKISVPEIRSWMAEFESENISFVQGNELDIGLRIYNRGNVVELFRISSESRQFPSLEGVIELLVPAKSDSTVYFHLAPGQTRGNKYNRGELKVDVADERGANMTLIANIQKTGSEIFQHHTKWYSLPLELGFQYVGAGRRGGSYYFNAVGSTPITKDESLSVTVRNQLFGTGNNKNNIYNLGYQYKNWSVMAGSIIKFSDFLVNGTGIQISNLGMNQQYHKVSLSKSKHAGHWQLDYEGRLAVSDKLFAETRLFSNMGGKDVSNNVLLNHSIGYQANEKWSIQGKLGVSKNFPEFDLGYLYGYNFRFNSDKYLLESEMSNYSANYIGINGGHLSHRHRIQAHWSDILFGAFYNQMARYQQNLDSLNGISQQSVMFSEFGFRIQGLEWGRYRFSSSLVRERQQFGGSESQPVVSDVWTGTVAYSNESRAIRMGMDQRLFYSFFPGGFEQKVFSYSNQFNSTFRNFGFNGSFSFGPRFYNEMVYGLEQGIEQKRYRLAPHYQWQGKKGKVVYNSTHLEFFHEESNFDRTMLLFRNSMKMNLERLKLSFSLSVSVDLLEVENRFVNLKLNRPLLLKSYGISKYHQLKLILFKDENGNGVKDIGEEGVRDGFVLINDRLGLTDNNGELTYRNVEKGAFEIDLKHLNSLQGWRSAKGYRMDLFLSQNETVYVPFEKSRFIIGKVNVVSDETSSGLFNPYGLRVKATSKSGEVRQTVVDKDGEFGFNLTKGEYIISLEVAAIPAEGYSLEKMNIAVDLVRNEKAMVDFVIRKAEREIRIRKLN
ncbi:hypothetical protein KZP23_02910 [Echinicola marina]|uniref:hypothetical protein n=1 Tax=Echinicola marina TaxID=2859768 RepID=UPI001CF62E2B|nr:hypothetical protein [Echinicola marina]UCS93998.1 hypothetical protein KZP23_02910 [Echinicola marina]